VSHSKLTKNYKNHDNPSAVDFNNDASQFTTIMINSAPVKDICGHPKMRPGDCYHAKITIEDIENGQIHGPPSSAIPVPLDAQEFDSHPSP